MKPSIARSVRVKLLPPGVQPPKASVPSIARVQKLRDAAPARSRANSEQSVAEQLRSAAQLPPNIRIEEHFSRKSRYWNVARQARSVLRNELAEA
ncbi:hypothetical protein MCUN1_003817 [Malassezia cuniculi]|uniref:Uncharacterized protein n=1 Tax=Malassezia cuniculi TaxID=948313 RepID=A0AAF0EU87_9BASI|nr:hypothetical protein MCUN1_003817 [Malassezia cuniculi]